MRGRVLAAGGSVLIAAAVNVTTGMLTQHWAAAWWAATAVLVIVGAGLQIWLTRESVPAPVRASGDGAIAAGGSARHVATTVTRAGRRSAEVPTDRGVTAAGRGAIAAGADVTDAQTAVSDEG